jgi:hypothetical protein
MIDYINNVLRAAADIVVLEKGVRQVVEEIQALIQNVQGGGLIILATHPGCGASTALKKIALSNKRSIIWVRADVFTHSANLTERLVDCFGMLRHEDQLKAVPRYLFEMMNCSGRKIILIEDIDMLWQSREEIAHLGSVISELASCAGAKIICSTKSMRFLIALLKWVPPEPCIKTMPRIVSAKAAKKFIHEYSWALSMKLGVQVNVPTLRADSAASIAELANIVRISTTVTMMQTRLAVAPTAGNYYVFRRYLEIASCL